MGLDADLDSNTPTTVCRLLTLSQKLLYHVTDRTNFTSVINHFSPLYEITLCLFRLLDRPPDVSGSTL